jgi:signal transduction histidine kinase
MDPTDKKATMPTNDASDRENFFRDIEIEFLIHELKDPIAVIETGMRSLIERQEKFGALSDRQERILQRSLRNARKARDMLHGLLEIGRSESGCFVCCRFLPAQVAYSVLMNALESSAAGIFEQCRPNLGKQQVLRLLADKGILFDIEPAAAEMEMVQDEVKFRQIVGNLFKNALHHRKHRMVVRASHTVDGLCVEVSDDGPGISRTDHEQVFRRYAQAGECTLTPRKGHGLGLAGARIMARCLGGDIQLDSRKGKGATFRLTLPLDLSKVIR